MLTIERIEEIIGGIDFYLKRLDEFTHSMKEVKSTLEQMRHSQEKKYMWEQEKLRIELNSIKQELQKRGLPENTEYELSLKMLKDFLYSDQWPKAVDPKIICTNDEMAFNRANSILDLVIGEHLEGKSFLDFGCGEGHVVMRALTQKPKFVLGYDINMSKCKFNNEHFTSEFDMVANHAPYDIILLQDVMDHLTEDPVTVLKRLKSVLEQDGRIYIRNHPWCSRHGSHLYTQINKAYAHLIFDESELSRIGGYVNDHTIKIYNPLETYRSWFIDAGYKICNEIVINKKIDKYFEGNNLIKDRILPFWQGDEIDMMKNIQIEFVEFTIEAITNQTEI